MCFIILIADTAAWNRFSANKENMDLDVFLKWIYYSVTSENIYYLYLCTNQFKEKQELIK